MADKLPPLYAAIAAKDEKKITSLLTHKWYSPAVDVNGTDTNRGFTPLHRAVEDRERSIVRLLLRFKPDVNACFSLISPMDLAQMWGHQDVIGWLTDAGAMTYQEIQMAEKAAKEEKRKVEEEAIKTRPDWEI